MPKHIDLDVFAANVDRTSPPSYLHAIACRQFRGTGVRIRSSVDALHRRLPHCTLYKKPTAMNSSIYILCGSSMGALMALR